MENSTRNALSSLGITAGAVFDGNPATPLISGGAIEIFVGVVRVVARDGARPAS
jgi:uncharacterized membrane protein (DUF441 family)